MADKVDMSLDDIIKMNNINKKPQFNRNGNRGNQQSIKTNNFRPQQTRRANPYSRPAQQNGGDRGQWKHDMYDGNRGQARVMISNLHYRVSDNDIKELFKEFGVIKKAAVFYDRSGRSLGNAEVVFMNKMSARKAMEKYNDVLLDGRKMKITLVEDAAQRFQQPQQPQQRRPMSGRLNQNGQRNGFRDGYNNNSNRNRFNNRTGNRTGGNRGPQQQNRNPPSKEQLDAELDAYVSKN